MRQVNLIAAVGRNGQLGLGNVMPWKDKEDLQFFRRMTMGDHVIMGGRTYNEIHSYLDGRICWSWSSNIDPRDMLDNVSQSSSPEQAIWIAGGAITYKAFMPFVRRSFITHIDYEGPSDVNMPALWGDME